MQRRACKLILGKDYTTLVDTRNQLDILSFEESIFFNKAKVMFKIATNAAPIYLTNLFQMRGDMQNLNSSQLNLRSTSNRNFLIPKPKKKKKYLKTVCLILVRWFGIVFPCG